MASDVKVTNFPVVPAVRVVGTLGVSYGVFWYVWGLYGFWWGALYGLFWPTWLGYRLAEYLLR